MEFISINKRKLREIDLQLDTLKVENNKKLNILNKWIHGERINIKDQKLWNVTELKTKKVCDNCGCNATYNIGKKNYCWSHLYLETLIKN